MELLGQKLDVWQSLYLLNRCKKAETSANVDAIASSGSFGYGIGFLV